MNAKRTSAEFDDFPEVPANAYDVTPEFDHDVEFPPLEPGSEDDFSMPPPGWNQAPDPFANDPVVEPLVATAAEVTEPAEVIAPKPAPTPAPVAKVKPARTPRVTLVAERTEEAAEPLDRLTDFKASYAARRLDVLEAEARASETLTQVLAAEERLAGGLKALLDRSEQLAERAERAEAALTLATDMLGQQAQIIARAFKEQLVKTEVDGRATLLSHLLEVADRVANSTTKALNDAAEEAAAFTGVKAEAAALQRVTQAVIEQAQANGLDTAIRTVVNASGRLTAAVDRIEAAPVGAQAAAPAAEPVQQATPDGVGALPLAYMWARHHLGMPGLFIGLGISGYGLYRFFG